MEDSAAEPISFQSFSIETTFFEEYLGYVSYPSTSSINIFQIQVSHHRFGGVAADSTTWNLTKMSRCTIMSTRGSGAFVNTPLVPGFGILSNCFQRGLESACLWQVESRDLLWSGFDLGDLESMIWLKLRRRVLSLPLKISLLLINRHRVELDKLETNLAHTISTLTRKIMQFGR